MIYISTNLNSYQKRYRNLTKTKILPSHSSRHLQEHFFKKIRARCLFCSQYFMDTALSERELKLHVIRMIASSESFKSIWSDLVPLSLAVWMDHEWYDWHIWHDWHESFSPSYAWSDNYDIITTLQISLTLFDARWNYKVFPKSCDQKTEKLFLYVL